MGDDWQREIIDNGGDWQREIIDNGEWKKMEWWMTDNRWWQTIANDL